MGEPEDGEALAAHKLSVWALSSFHTASLVALVLAALYYAGLAGDQLAALDTWVGVLAYLYLWGVVWWTNRSLLFQVGTDLVSDSPNPTVLLVAATKWGALAGLLVALPLLVVGLGFFVAAGGLEAVPFLVLAAAIGVLLAAGVGAVVGGVFALLDLLLLRSARVWLPGDDLESTRSTSRG